MWVLNKFTGGKKHLCEVSVTGNLPNTSKLLQNVFILQRILKNVLVSQSILALQIIQQILIR